MKKLILIGSATFFVFIVGFGVGNDTLPEPEIITETITETETVYVESEPEIIYQTEYQELPQSCLDIPGRTEALFDEESNITRLVGDSQISMMNMQTASSVRDLTEMTTEMRAIRDARSELDTVIVERAQIIEGVERAHQLCLDELE